jgi:hypothetical protein
MLKHPVNVLNYVGVRHPHNPKSLTRKPVRPPLVIFFLFGMGIAIHLNDQPRLRAEKVGNERPKPHLSAELETVDLARS